MALSSGTLVSVINSANLLSCKVKPGIYSGVFAVSGLPFAVAALAEDAGSFGVSKKPASDTDAEERRESSNC